MQRSGFTVVEVVIVTLFLSLCFWGGRSGLRWYTRASHADAAKRFVEELSAAQVKYLAKSGRYLALGGGRAEAFPREMPTGGAMLQALPEVFAELGITQAPDSPFYFRVAVFAGAESPPPPEALQNTALAPFSFVKGQPWFYIVAFADQDGDGEFSKLEAASWDKTGVVETDRTE